MRRVIHVSIVAVALLALANAAQAATITYFVNLSGPAEAPPNASPGTGTGLVEFDTTNFLMHVLVDFQGLLGPTTASHVHCCTAIPLTGAAGVATQVPTFVNFPLGVTSGHYDNTFNMLLASSWNPQFLGAQTPAQAFDALVAGSALGEAYLNIHTSTFQGGEIRGFLSPSPGAIPEPGSLTLLGLGLTGVLARLRRRRRP